MNTLRIALAGTFTIFSLLGCGADIESAGDESGADSTLESEPVAYGESQEALMSCTNPDGTNSVMAALAVATAQDLKRWQPTTDFVVFGTSGMSEASGGMQQAIKLTAAGKVRCSDGKCARVQALLDLQYDQANNKVKLPGGVILSPGALRSRLVAKLREQATCDSRPVNGGTGNCPAEQHSLIFQTSVKGSCDTNFYFVAKAADGVTALNYPAQLKNKLIWVDSTNPYVAFQSSGEIVSIDPTYGLNEDTSSSAGACTAACTKISTTSVLGECCSCNGINKTYLRSAWNANTYLCQ